MRQQEAQKVNDVFTRWIVGIAGAVVVAVGGVLLNSITELKVEVAKINETVKPIADHETRIRTLEKQSRDTTRSN